MNLGLEEVRGEVPVLAGDVGGRVHGGGLGPVAVGEGALQVVLVDEQSGGGAAHEGATDQTEGGGGHTDHRTRLGACRLQIGADAGGGAGTADEGDGATADAVEGVLIHQVHDCAAQAVLQQDHDEAEPQEEQDRFSALEQGGQADGVAHGGEEHRHEHGLEGVVKGDDDDAEGVHDGVDDGEAQTADQRGRDTKPVEDGNFGGQKVAQPEHEGAQRDSVVHVEIDFLHDDLSSPSSLDYDTARPGSGDRERSAQKEL